MRVFVWRVDRSVHSICADTVKVDTVTSRQACVFDIISHVRCRSAASA